MAAHWYDEELQGLQADFPDMLGVYDSNTSKYNPRPGTGRTGYLHVAPNNYPFYSEDEKYKPIMQSDGGQLSDWKPMYQPTTEQADKDRLAAYEAGVPHGYVPPGNKYKDLATIHLQVVSDLHDSNEYGAEMQEDGQHCGGPFYIDVSPTMRIEDLRLVIQEVGGVVPALQKLSYAGKNFEDSQRSLQQ
ncbi:MAG: hypothetical protein FRX49_08656 [Trebouxia sp. A1-2]|nr:MAG: hypothetical protein FRX49_08656 [Trebouxia sp. A1-2]